MVPEDQDSKILMVDSSEGELNPVYDVLRVDFPEYDIQRVGSYKSYEEECRSRDFDVVVVNASLDADLVHFIHELRLKDREPAILVVSAKADAKVIVDAHNAGAQKIVNLADDDLNKITPTLRHLLRLKKLEQENEKLLAALTKANALLDEKNKRLDEFSSTVAHDIRGPLGGICMKLEYLLDVYGSKNDTRFNDLVGKACDAGLRLADLVQSMYDYAKLGADAATMTEVDLAIVVDEVVNDLSFDPKLDISIGISDLPTVWGNENLLRRVFVNLISNAVKYSDKAHIIINVGTEGYFESPIGSFVKLYIEDNGPGLNSNGAKSLFTMFNRGESKNVEGMGLGLAIVTRILDLHHGNIEYIAKPDAGAKFLIDLPIRRVEFFR